MPVPSPDLPGDPIITDTDTAEGFPTHENVSFLGLGGEQSDLLSNQRRPVRDTSSRTARCSSTSLQRNGASFSWSLLSSSDTPSPTLPKLNIPSFLGDLGEVQRVEGSTDSWRWVIDELKRCPRDFATRGETLFLHRNLYGETMPRAIRAAMGISAASCTVEEDRRQLLFRAVDAEVLELFKEPPLVDAADGGGQGGMGGIDASGSGGGGGLTIIDELARLQALTLYQMMRMFGGGLEERLVVEQQRDLLTKWALQLLLRSKAELDGDRCPASDANRHVDCWHSWIVAESIRRTVMVVFMFYGTYSLATQGFCSELPTLAKLPVSAASASWHSEAAYLARSRSGEAQKTLTYEEYTQCWTVSPPERMDSFDKFLVVPCKGLERIVS